MTERLEPQCGSTQRAAAKNHAPIAQSAENGLPNKTPILRENLGAARSPSLDVFSPQDPRALWTCG
ncbi:hypothetical protein PIIN_11220 [Serendipita indica DSM 11827]|uniref:Uncharacterized protein n=1 Tax=Serendipita indica (strain DSM 11827) TaxID=1109443 RepID=G4U0Z4_SERID|nr:hypothetical protein PIIN_11220 [Serendipita indica DSM 11827]